MRTNGNRPTATRPDRPETRRRVTVPEAAEALGITVEAVRGRIKRGKLGHIKDGGTVYVLLPVDQSRPDTTSPQPDNDQTNDQSKLIERLERQVEDLQTRLDREQEANSENRRIIMRLAQGIPEIQAAPESPDTPPEPVQREETPADAEGPENRTSRPWWRRWLVGV